MKNIAVIGSGSWGVALSIHLAKMGHNVKIWSFTQEETDLINKDKKCKFLPKAIIPDNIRCSMDFEEVIKDTEIVLIVTPSKFTRSTVQQFKKYITDQQIIICSKGLEQKTLSTLSEVLEEELPNSKIGVLSGPSHAEEVSLGVLTAIVIASKHEEVKKNITNTFMNDEMRIYSSNDVKGVELGGAFKNIIAFCAGVAAGLNLGDNTFAALATRGLVEIARLGTAMGAQKETFYGLTGLGDLIVTCLSEHSRNRKAGLLIGQGKSIEEAKEEVGMTIESIDNIEAAYELSKKYKVEMPMVEAAYAVLYNNLLPEQAAKMLMTREAKGE